MDASLFDFGPHGSYIVASYAVITVVLGGLIAWIVLDHRQLRRTLQRMEDQGLTRRRRPSNSQIDAEQDAEKSVSGSKMEHNGS